MTEQEPGGAKGRFSRLRRLFARADDAAEAGGGLHEPIERLRDLEIASERLTAREAFALAAPEAASIDPAAVLTGIACPDVQPDGSARVWEFLYAFPTLLSIGVVGARIGLDERGEVSDAVLETRVRPSFATGSILAEATRRAGLSERERRQLWSKTEQIRALPVSFRDSPEATRLLAELGADFLSGPSDMPLSATVTETGEAVWQTWMWDRQFRVPFVAD